MDKDKIMEQLVAKFLDGATSNEEERRLYDYFTGSRVASHLHKYKAMFEWYAGGMAAPLPPVAEPKGRRARTVPMWAKVAAGAAAAVLIVAGASVAYQRHAKTERMYAIYSGSYIVRGGKKITDLKVIMPELRRIEHEACALGNRYKGIGRMSPKEIFKMMENENKQNSNRPTI